MRTTSGSIPTYKSYAYLALANKTDQVRQQLTCRNMGYPKDQNTYFPLTGPTSGN